MRTTGENIKLTLNGITVNYDDNGPLYAPPIIFLHGFPFNKSMWEMQAEALKNNFRVISYDLRGHGNTVATDGNFSLETLTDDLIQFMDALHLKRVMLCAISLGAYIALNAVEKHPERFNAMVVSGVQCQADTEDVKEERLKIIEHIKDRGIDEYVDESMKHLFATRSFTSRKEEVRAVRNMIIATPVKSICDTLLALTKRKETCGQLSEINMPVMILAGKEDYITPVSAAQFIHKSVKGSVLHILDYAGHLANMENTHDFNEHLKDFVNQVCVAKRLSKHCSET
jgi:3-oxoadipate enol-lactonase